MIYSCLSFVPLPSQHLSSLLLSHFFILTFKGITMVPRVLVGARTNDDEAVSEPVAIGSSPTHSSPGAVHLVAEAADGKGPLRASRTIFLSQGVLTQDLFAGESLGRR
jgi:hypothetical protein